MEARGVDKDGDPVLPLIDAIKQEKREINIGTAHVGTSSFVTDGGSITISSSDNVGFGTTGNISTQPETHPGDETDDEIRTSIEEDAERVHEISRAHCHPEFSN